MGNSGKITSLILEARSRGGRGEGGVTSETRQGAEESEQK